jgi:hypothetical protein
MNDTVRGAFHLSHPLYLVTRIVQVIIKPLKLSGICMYVGGYIYQLR